MRLPMEGDDTGLMDVGVNDRRPNIYTKLASTCRRASRVIDLLLCYLGTQ